MFKFILCLLLGLNVALGAENFVKDTSSGASFNGNAKVLLPSVKGFSVQLVWTGTTQGTIKLQASNECSSSWIDITGASAAPAGSASSALLNISDSFYECIRVVFTRTGGTGLINAYFVGKE